MTPAAEPVERAAPVLGARVLGEAPRGRGEVGAPPKLEHDGIRLGLGLVPSPRARLGRDDDLPERDRGRAGAESGLLLVEELPHLLFGRRHRFELALAAQLLDQPVLKRRPPLLIGQPAAVLLRRLEARLLSSALYSTSEVKLPRTFFTCSSTRSAISSSVTLMEVSRWACCTSSSSSMMTRRSAVVPRRDPGRIGGQLGALGLPRKDLLLHLRGQNGTVTYHREHPIHHEGGVRSHRRSRCTGTVASAAIRWYRWLPPTCCPARRDRAAERQRPGQLPTDRVLPGLSPQ